MGKTILQSWNSNTKTMAFQVLRSFSEWWLTFSVLTSRAFAGVTPDKNPRKKQCYISDLGSTTTALTASTTSVMRPGILGDQHTRRKHMYKVHPVTRVKKGGWSYYG